MAASDNRGGAGEDEPPSLDAFSERLGRLRGEPEAEGPKNDGWGRAMRASSDLLAGLLVGTLLGLGLDRLLGTAPWLMLAGIGLGFAAGLLNLSRSMKN